MDHDHSTPTHSADCDETGCTYVAHAHAHDDASAAHMLSEDLAAHNQSVHGKQTDVDAIIPAVQAKMVKSS